MRNLTEDELKIAPDWATHYLVYYDGDIRFESESRRCVYSTEVNRVTFDGAASGIHRACNPLPKKPFDITKHEWSDVVAGIEAEANRTLILKFKGSWISLDKDDGMAIAKHFWLTAEDLK